MTALTERPDVAESSELQRAHGRIRALTITVVVLAVALVGLGAWVIYDQVADTDTSVTGEIQSLLDDYTAAWNDYDSEAFLALVSDDYTFDGTGVDAMASRISQLGGLDWNVEVIGDPIMAGDGPFYFVAQVNHVTNVIGDEDGVSLFTIVESDGSYLISEHVFTGGL